MKIIQGMKIKALVLTIICYAVSLNLTAQEDNGINSEQINIALRKVGHQMLLISGDATSQIRPVAVTEGEVYELQLEVPINYDTLPTLMHQALHDIEIDVNYIVTVRNCESDKILLGYDRDSYIRNETACVGREYRETCNMITLTFPEEKESGKKRINPFIIISLFLLGGIILITKYKSTEDDRLNQTYQSSNALIKIGNSTIDPRNQIFTSPEGEQTLTYRENKLLVYLATHRNQVIERNIIVSKVWGDEGVIVGRSLDVFISRLRKLLKNDPDLLIKNIHGVGYRLEVKNE